MNAIRAVVSDLDDTLLNENGQLSDYTVRVLKRCTERGIRVILCSGRMPHSMQPHVERLETHQPYICGNGAKILSYDHRELFSKGIDVEVAKQIIRFMDERGIYVHTYRDDCFVYSTENEAAQNYQRLAAITPMKVDNLAEYLDFPAPKLLCIANPAIVSDLLPQVQQIFAGHVDVTTSSPNYLEICAAGVSKGQTLQRLADRIGLTPETTAVFGDGLNDVSMLTWTPHGVAVANARSEVRQAASCVCGRNTEDGVACFIEKEVLNA